MSNEELTLKEAAGFLKISPRTLYNRCCAGTAPEHVKRDGKLWFRATVLEAYQKSRTEIRKTNWYALKKSA